MLQEIKKKSRSLLPLQMLLNIQYLYVNSVIHIWTSVPCLQLFIEHFLFNFLYTYHKFNCKLADSFKTTQCSKKEKLSIAFSSFLMETASCCVVFRLNCLHSTPAV